MDGPVLHYEIIRNQLDNGTKYIGNIISTLTYSNEAIIEEIVKRNSTVTRQEALAVIDLYEEIIRQILRKGNTVTTGIFRASLSMRGAFESKTDKIDYRKHSARVVIRPASGLNKKVCTGIRFHKFPGSRERYFISFVINLHDHRDRILFRGGMFEIGGKGLKVYNYENRYDLAITASDGSVSSLDVFEASPSRLLAVVPAGLPAGPASLSLRLSYASVVRKFQKIAVEII